MNNNTEFTILVVDDETANLDVLTHILRTHYAIRVAKSGPAALKRALDERPDLMLLDIVMPGMDGFEVLAELKACPETSEIPVIFITGKDSIEDEERGLFLGAVDYIRKPFHNSIVRARVKTQLQIVKQLRTITQLGLIDPLTELPNRRAFDNQICLEWNLAERNKSPLSLLILDADKFKNYNDTYGHPQGDALLQGFGRVLASSLKRKVDLAARIGGEEFAVLLSGTDLGGGMAVAEKIRANIEALRVPNLNGGEDTSITASIGLASCVPTPEKSLSEFIQDADKALYAAKEQGRNRVAAHTG